MRWYEGCSVQGLLDKEALSDKSCEFGNRLLSLPKLELHVHLEAAVGAEFYGELNNRVGMFAAEDLPSMRAPFPDFKSFIGAWIDNTRLVQREDDIEDMVVSFAQERERLNIVYSDVHISPSDFSNLRSRFGDGKSKIFDFESLLLAYLRGAQKAAILYPRIWFRFVVDAVWLANENDLKMLGRVIPNVQNSAENIDPRGGRFISALGLGGPETIGNLEVLARGLIPLREHNLKLEIHAGETGSWQEQKQALAAFAPDRVAHGLAGAFQGEFHGGHTVFCPISNIRTGAVFRISGLDKTAGLSALPFQHYSCKNVSIGSDDPLLFKTNLILEHVVLFERFGAADRFFDDSQQKALLAAFDQKAANEALGRSHH